MESFTVQPDAHGMRLDAVMGAIFPELGLRGRRRLWQWRRVLVNGRERPPGYTAAAGDTVTLEFRGDSAPVGEASGIAVIHREGDFVALYKPAGLHSAHVAGSPLPSLEALLPDIWADLYAACAAGPSSAETGGTTPPPRLLTRLDGPTSGIVLGALCAEAQQRFRAWEAAGLVTKSYLAVTHGAPERPLRIDRQLRVDGRSKTLVLSQTDPDPARHTEVEAVAASPEGLLPEAFCSPGEFFLVRARIRRGARHQIRAHLACAGYPLVGDTLYGGQAPATFPAQPEGTLPAFLLHHAAVDMPGFHAECPAPWRGCVSL